MPSQHCWVMCIHFVWATRPWFAGQKVCIHSVAHSHLWNICRAFVYFLASTSRVKACMQERSCQSSRSDFRRSSEGHSQCAAGGCHWGPSSLDTWIFFRRATRSICNGLHMFTCTHVAFKILGSGLPGKFQIKSSDNLWFQTDTLRMSFDLFDLFGASYFPRWFKF